jgi:hypothetical protein
MEAYGSADAPAIAAIVHAVCARSARCDAEAGDGGCEVTLTKKLSGSAQGRSLALARPELIAQIAMCIDRASCTESNPVAACSEKGDEAAPR